MSFQKPANPNQQKPLMLLAEAQRKIMDLVARRDHSEKELRRKLSVYCDENVIEQAINWAREKKWLAKSEALKENVAQQLERRGKGIAYINEKLQGLGLEPIKADQQQEHEKAKKLVLSRWSASDFAELGHLEAQKLKAKIIRFLTTRGFESDIISNILKNEFKAGALSNDEEY
jgi:regulatory protein